MKIKIQSQFVSGEDVKQGDIVYLLDEGEYRKLPEQFRREGRENVLTFQMKLPDGNIKFYTMNKTTQQNLIGVYGDDSKNWINKDLKVHLITQNVAGKMKKVIYLTPPSWETPEPPTE